MRCGKVLNHVFLAVQSSLNLLLELNSDQTDIRLHQSCLFVLAVSLIALQKLHCNAKLFAIWLVKWNSHVFILDLKNVSQQQSTLIPAQIAQDA